MRTKTERSAGGVIYRGRRGQLEVCLIATQGGKAWQLPKGLIEQGEPPEEAARREVEEETGLRGELVGSLDKIEYWYVYGDGERRTRVHKFVTFYLLRCTGGSTENHDDEVDDARWFPLPEAAERLSFEGERGVMRLAREQLEAEH